MNSKTGRSSTVEAYGNATKAAPTVDTSAKRLSKLSTKDGSRLTSQDAILLAMLAELREQGYQFKVMNLKEPVSPTAIIYLTGRVWKQE